MKNIYKLFFGIAMVAMFTGCSEDKESNPISEIDTDTPTPSVGTLITINAAVDTDQSLSKVALQQADNSLDLLSQWQEDDQIQVFARQNGKNYKISDQIAVESISADGRSCSFNIVLPSEIDPAKTYQVIGLCGVLNHTGIPNMCKSGIFYLSQTIISEISKFSASVIDDAAVKLCFFCHVAIQTRQHLIY